MIPVVNDIKYTPFTPSLHIVFADGETADVAADGLGLSNSGLSADAGAGTLPLGVAIGRSFTIELLNDQAQWNDYDFLGATISLTLTYDTGDTITLADFTCTKPPEKLDAFIQITCLDAMWRADKPFATALPLPYTLGDLWRNMCNSCGLPNGQISSPVFALVRTEALPDGLTFRQVFGAIAGLAGGNARIDAAGNIVIAPYLIPDDNTDPGDLHTLDNWIEVTTALHDVQITGVSAVVRGAETDTTVTVGNDGYVLQIENPLLNTDNAQTILANIFSQLGGKAIAPFSGDAFYYPLADIGDACAVIERDGTARYSVITAVSWPLGGRTHLACDIDAPATAGRQYVDPTAQALIQARQLIARERTAREQAVITLQQAIASASGMYTTAVVQPDESTIYYLHDKATLAASQKIIKLTSDVIALSTDGGQTYPYGFQLSGDMVMRIVAAAGINANWINTGALTVLDDNDNVLFSANVGAGTVFIAGISVSDGVVTVGTEDGSYVKLTRNGLELYAKDQKFAQFGIVESALPRTTSIPLGGYLQLGQYRAYDLYGGFALGV